jgi:hypothetical protein
MSRDRRGRLPHRRHLHAKYWLTKRRKQSMRAKPIRFPYAANFCVCISPTTGNAVVRRLDKVPAGAEIVFGRIGVARSICRCLAKAMNKRTPIMPPISLGAVYNDWIGCNDSRTTPASNSS